MSGSGAPNIELAAAGMRVAIVAASWHEEVMAGLLAGAQRACAQAEAVVSVLRVPGSFELPVVARACAISGRFDAIVTLGVIIRGGTPHFEYVSQATTSGLSRIALDFGIPVGFGLLTCDDERQARDRAGLAGSQEDKGAEAAWAAMSTVAVIRSVAPRA